MEDVKANDAVQSYMNDHLLTTFAGLIQMIADQLTALEGDAINTVRISFLRSSILDDSPWFRIDLCTQDDYTDRIHTQFYWSDGDLLQIINSYRPVVEFYDLHADIKRKEQEFKRVKQLLSENCHMYLLERLPDFAREMDITYFISHEIALYYGEYLGPSLKII